MCKGLFMGGGGGGGAEGVLDDDDGREKRCLTGGKEERGPNRRNCGAASRVMYDVLLCFGFPR